MTKTEITVIKNVIRRLHGENCSDEVKAALTGPAKLYLESWVIPALELLLPDCKPRRDPQLAKQLTKIG